ncbi:MAG TPA: sugar nucleotide-binding protein, partial [Staphylococcus kloosii]
MKIVVIGATGTIGQRVVEKLEQQHEVIKVGSQSGDYQVDITSVDSIKKMYE